MPIRAVSKVAKGKRGKSSVFRGTKARTSGGLKKEHLKKNKNGKVVSKKASDAAKKSKQGKKIAAWANACSKARKALGINWLSACSIYGLFGIFMH